MISNSISGVLDDVVKATANNMNMYTAIHEAVFSNQPSVKTQVYLENGEARDVEVPSLGYMKSRVDRLDSTIETLVGATGNSIVRMSDGSYRKLYINRLDIPRETEFASTTVSKSISDALTNMMAQKVAVDIPLKLYNSENQVELNIVAYHGATLNNLKSTLSYSELKQALDEYKEAGTIDEYLNFKELRTIEPADMSAYGGVYVLRVVDTESVDANENVEHKKIYYISDVAFKGKEGSTYPISTGDILTLYNSQGYHDTRVKVEIIDKTKGYIKVSYVDGYQPITIGSQLFPYVDSNRSTGIVKYEISNRYQYWIYPTLVTKSGYRHEEGSCIYVNGSEYSDITDLGKYIDKFKTDNYKTVDEWIDASIQESEIDPPSVANDTENSSFTIVDVSKDISTSSYTKITQLESQKKSVENAIEAYQDRINVLRSIISTGTAGSDVKKDLASTTQSLTDAQNEFNTLVFNISDELNSNVLDSKYEIHGIIKLKEDITTSSASFACIGVEVRYRFIGNDTDIQKKEFYDLNGTKIPFNAWKILPINYRGRTYDIETKKYQWDPNTTNQSSIVIPIETRYNTIIQYRYVYEAGYPENPQKSKWSDDIYVPWDSTIERSSMKAIQNINQADQVKASIGNTLSSNGVYSHIDDSFTSGERYFAHSAENIASGWVTSEQVPISLYEKMKEIVTVSEELNDAFNAIDVNNFNFTLIKPDGTSVDIQEGTANTIVTPTYMDILKSQNGVTVSSSNTSNINYVGSLKYTLRISAKSKYVRFMKVKSVSETAYAFTTIEHHKDDSTMIDYLKNSEISPILTDNREHKLVLLNQHDELDTIKNTENNSIYRDGTVTDTEVSFATILKDDSKGLLFNEGSTLPYADETSLDVPITVVVAPISCFNNLVSPALENISASTKYDSAVTVRMNIGSYINALDLTIGITFRTSCK